MKIIQINNDQLEVNESGTSALIIGILFVLVGIYTALSPLLLKGAAWWMSLIGAGIIAISVFVVFSAKNRHIVFLKTGTSTVTETKVIGGKSQTVSFDAGQIVSVGLETRTQYQQNTSSTSNNTTPQRERVSTLFITLRDNSEILLATSKNGMNGINISGVNVSSFGAAPLSKEANQISQFFGVPLSSSNQGTVGLEDIGRVIGGITNGFELSPQQPIVNLAQPVVPQAPLQPLQPTTPAQQPVVVSTPVDIPPQTPPTPPVGPSF